MNISGQFARAVAGLAIAASAFGAQAQNYPSKPIWMVLPFSSAGAIGLLARSLGERFTGAWGQPVLVDAKPGAGGIVATQAVANAAPDGQTLLFGTVNLSIAPALYRNVPYDPDTALVPVVRLVTVPNVLVARANLPVETMRDLVAMAKSSPGKLNYASPAAGSFPNLAAEMFKHEAGVSMTHIPYRGTPATVVAILAGEVDVMFTNLLDVLPQIKAGKLKALAVTSKERFAALPDVPTVAEAGLPGFEAAGWFGLFAPRNTPPAIVEMLNRETNAMLADPKMKTWLREQGFEAVGGTPASFAAFARTDRARWTEVIRYSGVKPE